MPKHIEDAAQAFVDHCASGARYGYHAAHLFPVSLDLCFDERCAMLIGDKDEVQLTKTLMIVFRALLEARDCPVSAEALAVRLTGDYGEVPVTKTVRNSVSLLRKRLAQLSSAVHIETRYGFGYCLRVDLRPPQIS